MKRLLQHERCSSDILLLLEEWKVYFLWRFFLDIGFFFAHFQVRTCTWLFSLFLSFKHKKALKSGDEPVLNLAKN